MVTAQPQPPATLQAPYDIVPEDNKVEVKVDDDLNVKVDGNTITITEPEPKKKPEKKEKEKAKEKPKEESKPEPTPEPKPEPKKEHKETTNVVTNETSNPEPKEEPKQNNDWIPFEFTHYVATCAGCSGTTSTGIDVTNTTTYQGMQIVAVNPAVIPYGSIIEMKYPDGHTTKAIAEDTGSAIRARTDLLDILVSSQSEADANGRVQGQIRILEEGQ